MPDPMRIKTGLSWRGSGQETGSASGKGPRALIVLTIPVMTRTNFFAFAGGNVVEVASFFLDAELFQQAQQDTMTLDCPVIAYFVVTVAGMAGQDDHAVGSLVERLQTNWGSTRPLHITRMMLTLGG